MENAAKGGEEVFTSGYVVVVVGVGKWISERKPRREMRW
jgi:hypothetical protein